MDIEPAMSEVKQLYIEHGVFFLIKTKNLLKQNKRRIEWLGLQRFMKIGWALVNKTGHEDKLFFGHWKRLGGKKLPQNCKAILLLDLRKEKLRQKQSVTKKKLDVFESIKFLIILKFKMLLFCVQW